LYSVVQERLQLRQQRLGAHPARAHDRRIGKRMAPRLHCAGSKALTPLDEHLQESPRVTVDPQRRDAAPKNIRRRRPQQPMCQANPARQARFASGFVRCAWHNVALCHLAVEYHR
jgi:hypothetical protein